MRALLDVNFLIALFDEDHAFNERAHLWLETHLAEGWASCPLTENGLVRILAHRNYSPKIQYSPARVIEVLLDFCRGSDHEFWPDTISLRDEAVFAAERIHGTRQITDLYLLALATQRGGCLVTFDQTIPLGVVPAARRENLVIV